MTKLLALIFNLHSVNIERSHKCKGSKRVVPIKWMVGTNTRNHQVDIVKGGSLLNKLLAFLMPCPNAIDSLAS